jgi:hypothetical protein
MEDYGGKAGIAAEFPDKNQAGKTGWGDPEEAGEQAERVSHNRQPTEQQAPDPVAMEEPGRSRLLLLIDPEDPADQKIGAPQSDQIGGAGAEEVAKGGGNNQENRVMAVEEQEQEQPFGAEGQQGGCQETEEKEMGEAGVSEKGGQGIHHPGKVGEKSSLGKRQLQGKGSGLQDLFRFDWEYWPCSAILLAPALAGRLLSGEHV